MNIELTEQQRQLAQEGQPIDVVDPQTNKAYVLIAKERFDQVRRHLASKQEPASEIAEGIRLSQEAFRRDLPDLLKQKRLMGQFAAYHRNERLSIRRDGYKLLQECFKRGLEDTEFYVGWIHPTELIEEEEIEPRWHHYGE